MTIVPFAKWATSVNPSNYIISESATDYWNTFSFS